MKPCNSHFKFT